jgi:hypothetical protein
MSSEEKSNTDILTASGMASEGREVIFVGEQNQAVHDVHDRMLILSGWQWASEWLE